MAVRWRERVAVSRIAPPDVASAWRECNLSTTGQLSGIAVRRMRYSVVKESRGPTRTIQMRPMLTRAIQLRGSITARG
jgi:hypothetical protein